ncbi:MAG: hypothetical protein SOU19_08810 [Candidatus Caccosoma sp.]|nr:hypothetical protein [Candidatus Caccosoma sp.]
MLNEIEYQIIDKKKQLESYGLGAELGMGLIAAFGVIAIITVVIYKVYGSKSGDITLPGGFKFKFSK